jgi:hypothetical protein
MNKDIFEDYVSVDSHVTTSGVETVQELCESLVASRVSRGKKEDKKKMANPKFCQIFPRRMKR